MVPEPRSRYAVQFFLLAAGLLTVAIGMSVTLSRMIPMTAGWRNVQFTVAFSLSSMLLFTGSTCLQLAVAAVRRERQELFRRWLLRALVAGTLFVAVQSFALARYMSAFSADDAELGSAAFIVMIAGLHGMHFIVALLVLCYVTIQAFAHRYDHEYYWGAWICSMFWHLLGLAWLAVLGAMLIARFFTEAMMVG